MKKLIIKIGLLIMIVVAISAVLVNVVLPDFWGHLSAEGKFRHLKSNKEKYNTVFVGSSRIFHHVIPGHFDSLCRNEGLQVESFNLGVRQFPCPQSFLLYHKLLQDPGSLKYIFMEVTSIAYEAPGPLTNSPRYYYWYDLEQTRMICEHIAHMDSAARLPFEKRMDRYYLRHFFNWTKKNLFVGGPQSLLLSQIDGEKEWVMNSCTEADGFLEIGKGPGPFQDQFIAGRKELLSDTGIIGERRKAAYLFVKNVPSEFTPYRNYMHDLLKEAGKAGIKLFFIIPPCLRNYAEVNRITYGLPDSCVLDLSSPALYPEFYMPEYYFDRAHMNVKGARVFTNELFKLAAKEMK